MKLKNVLNPLNISLNDFKDPAFQEGMLGVALWMGAAYAIGYFASKVFA